VTPDERLAKVAEVLAGHRLMFWTVEHVWGDTKEGSRTSPRCSCGVLRSGGGVGETLDSQVAWHEAHVAQALTPLLDAFRAEDEARALREAGQDFLAEHANRGPQRPVSVRRWMFDRADRIGGGA
jgi:hypothetical protein